MAREIFGSLPLRQEIDALRQRLDAAVQTRMRVEMRTLVERASRWLVTNRRPPLDSQATVGDLLRAVQRVMARLPELMAGARAGRLRAAPRRLVARGVPEDLATRVAVLPPAYQLLGVVEVGRSATELDADDVARVHFALGERLGLPALVGRILGAAARGPLADDGARRAA